MKTEPKSTPVIGGKKDAVRGPRQAARALSNLRRRSAAGFYGLAGLLGALGGLLIGRGAIVLARVFLELSPPLASAVLTGLGSGIFAGTLGTTLYIAMRVHHHHKLRWTGLTTSLLGSLVAGGLTGAIFQIFFNGLRNSPRDNPGDNTAVVIVATSIVGAVLLGILLSRNIPNLSPIRGLVAGLAAGLVSLLITGAAVGAGVGTGIACPVGLIVLGGAVGLGLSFVETRFRDAVLQVNWSPDDKTYVGLGPSPVSVGGGNDDIFIPGAPSQISSIRFSDGQVEHIETASGKRTSLQDGNRLRINGLTMVLHAASGSASRGTKAERERK